MKNKNFFRGLYEKIAKQEEFVSMYLYLEEDSKTPRKLNGLHNFFKRYSSPYIISREEDIDGISLELNNPGAIEVIMKDMPTIKGLNQTLTIESGKWTTQGQNWDELDNLRTLEFTERINHFYEATLSSYPGDPKFKRELIIEIVKAGGECFKGDIQALNRWRKRDWGD